MPNKSLNDFIKQKVMKRKAPSTSSKHEFRESNKRLKIAKIPATRGLMNMVFKVDEIVPAHIELTPPDNAKSLYKTKPKSTSSETDTEEENVGNLTTDDLKKTEEQTQGEIPDSTEQQGLESSDDSTSESKSLIELKKPSKKLCKTSAIRRKITHYFNWAKLSKNDSDTSEGEDHDNTKENHDNTKENHDNAKENHDNTKENKSLKYKEVEDDLDSEVKVVAVLQEKFETLKNTVVVKIRGPKLDLSYYNLFEKDISDQIFQELENGVEYFTGDLTKVNIYGKWRNIPRKQAAYGDEGLTYTFSGNTLPAKPWTPLLKVLCLIARELAQADYNFVLVNRYNSGQDCIGEHRDDEPDLDPYVPIASMSFGQQREFLLRHKDVKFKRTTTICDKRIELEHGSLLLMNYPTNFHWYHSLPRCSTLHPRINLTFRKIIPRSDLNVSENLDKSDVSCHDQDVPYQTPGLNDIPSWVQKSKRSSQHGSEASPQDYRRGSEASPQDYRRRSEASPQDYRRRSEASPQDYRRRSEASPQDYRRHSEVSPQDYRRRSEASPQDYRRGSEASPQDYRRRSEASPQDYRRSSEASSKLYQRGSEASSKLYQRGSEASSKLFQRGSEASTQLYQRDTEASPQLHQHGSESSPQLYLQDIKASPIQYKQQDAHIQQYQRMVLGYQQDISPTVSPFSHASNQ